jgi:hypothetical protein
MVVEPCMEVEVERWDAPPLGGDQLVCVQEEDRKQRALAHAAEGTAASPPRSSSGPSIPNCNTSL